MTDTREFSLKEINKRVVGSLHSYPLSSTLKACSSVLNAEHITIRATLYVIENAILPFFPVLRAAGLKLLQEK